MTLLSIITIFLGYFQKKIVVLANCIGRSYKPIFLEDTCVYRIHFQIMSYKIVNITLVTKLVNYDAHKRPINLLRCP